MASNSANPNHSSFDEAVGEFPTRTNSQIQPSSPIHCGMQPHQLLLWDAGSSQQSAPMDGQTKIWVGGNAGQTSHPIGRSWVHNFHAGANAGQIPQPIRRIWVGGNAGQTSQAMDGKGSVGLDLQFGSLPYEQQWPPMQQQLSQQNSLASAQETNLAQGPQSVLGTNSGQTLQGMQPIGTMGSRSPNSQLGTNGSFSFPKPAINNGQVRQQQLSQQNSLDSTQVIGTMAALGLYSQRGTNGSLSYGQQAINNGQFRQQQLSQQNSLDSPQETSTNKKSLEGPLYANDTSGSKSGLPKRSHPSDEVPKIVLSKLAGVTTPVSSLTDSLISTNQDFYDYVYSEVMKIEGLDDQVLCKAFECLTEHSFSG